jgi:hypothetical protein
MAGKSSSSAPGYALDEGHRDRAGEMAEGRSEMNWDGHQSLGGEPPRQANDGRPDATLGAARAPGGSNIGADVQAYACGAERQYPTPTGGDATGVNALHNEHVANMSHGGANPPDGNI